MNRFLRRHGAVIFWAAILLIIAYTVTEHTACTYVIIQHVSALVNCHQVPFWSHAPALVPGR